MEVDIIITKHVKVVLTQKEAELIANYLQGINSRGVDLLSLEDTERKVLNDFVVYVGSALNG